MPLNEIPQTLLDSSQRLNFVAWLRQIPLPLNATRQLVADWETNTGAKLTPEERRFLITESEASLEF